MSVSHLTRTVIIFLVATAVIDLASRVVPNTELASYGLMVSF